MTRVRRDSLPTSLTDASLRLRDVSAVEKSSACVDATKQSKRRPSAPNCSVTAGQRAVSRPVEQVRTNYRNSGIGRSTVSHESRRQTAVTVSNSSCRVSAEQTQSARGDRSLHSADEVANTCPDAERRSRPSTVRARSFIPRPVSCSGRHTAPRRHEDRDAAMTTKPVRFEPVLRRFDSGVDVAAAGLSPSDDGPGDASLEAVVQRLSASLESCTLALLADNHGTSPVRQKEPAAINAVDSLDDEYY